MNPYEIIKDTTLRNKGINPKLLIILFLSMWLGFSLL